MLQMRLIKSISNTPRLCMYIRIQGDKCSICNINNLKNLEDAKKNVVDKNMAWKRANIDKIIFEKN